MLTFVTWNKAFLLKLLRSFMVTEPNKPKMCTKTTSNYIFLQQKVKNSPKNTPNSSKTRKQGTDRLLTDVRTNRGSVEIKKTRSQVECGSTELYTCGTGGKERRFVKHRRWGRAGGGGDAWMQHFTVLPSQLLNITTQPNYDSSSSIQLILSFLFSFNFVLYALINVKAGCQK